MSARFLTRVQQQVALDTRFIVRASLYAALYAALTLAPGLTLVAYGQGQFRASECLLAFACFDLAAVPGLFVGTAIANLRSQMGIADVVFGSLLTLLAAAVMWYLGARLIAFIVPVVVNGFGVGAELALVSHFPFWPSVGLVSLGEAGVMVILGLPVFYLVRNHGSLFGMTIRKREE